MLHKTFSQEMQAVKDQVLLLSSMVEETVMNSLERMADYAKGIARINLRSGGLSLPRILRDIYSMAEKAVDMLHRAMTAFANEDVHAAKAIMQEDDIIDKCYSKLYAEAIHSVLGEPGNIERANYVIWTAHNLERLGDRIINICEKVAYIVTSEQLELSMVLDESKLDLGGSEGA